MRMCTECHNRLKRLFGSYFSRKEKLVAYPTCTKPEKDCILLFSYYLNGIVMRDLGTRIRDYYTKHNQPERSKREDPSTPQ